MVLWFEFAKEMDEQDTALLCSLKHAHCAIFQHLHPTRTLRLPGKNTHARGIGDVLTHRRKIDPGAHREGGHRRGAKGRKRGCTHCDAQEYHVCHPSLGEQWNNGSTITLYLSLWATSVMAAHALNVSLFLMWPEKCDPVRADPGEFHLDKHMQSCAQIQTHTQPNCTFVCIYTHTHVRTCVHTRTHTRTHNGEAVLSKISSHMYKDINDIKQRSTSHVTNSFLHYIQKLHR